MTQHTQQQRAHARQLALVEHLDRERRTARLDVEGRVDHAGRAELGEVLAQLMALALDPYPRLEGAVLPDEASDAAAGPFATLSRLKRENP